MVIRARAGTMDIELTVLGGGGGGYDSDFIHSAWCTEED